MNQKQSNMMVSATFFYLQIIK